MAKNKTTENENSVLDYLQQITDENRRKDCSDLVERMSKLTGFPAKMWGTGIVGFGSYHYKYESGHEGDEPMAAFASRVNALVLYFGLTPEQKEELLPIFGKHKISKACIYIQKLKDIDTGVLDKMIVYSIENMQKDPPLHC